MGQKVNPTIFRIKHTNNWDSKYFEKKSTESSFCDFKTLEVKAFIRQFFASYNLNIRKLKISYSLNKLHIFISYFPNIKTLILIKNINKKQNITIEKQKKWFFYKKKKAKKYLKLKKAIKNYVKYDELKSIKNLKIATFRFLQKARKTLRREKKKLKIRRFKFLKYYKTYLLTAKYRNKNTIQTNSFLNKFFESLSQFTCNKFKIIIFLNKTNSSIKKTTIKKNKQFLKKSLISLKKYEQNNFFKEGINLLYICCIKKSSAQLIANFIAIHIKNQKNQYFLLNFIKATLILFCNTKYSKIEGVKIKIKGKFNRSARARRKFIIIKKNVPVLTLNSKINYAESTAYTSKGTFGIKVWICEK